MPAVASIKRAWPIFASVAMFHLAFPPFNLGLLVFVALAPWLASLKGLDGRQAAKSGYVFGVLFWLGQFLFVQHLTYVWTGNVPLSLAPYVVGAVLIGPWYFALFAWLASKAIDKGFWWLVPLLWAGVEVLRSYFPLLAFPWGLAATPLAMQPMLCQLAWFGTVYAVSAWVLMANVLAAKALMGEPFVNLRLALMGFASLLALSLVRYAAPIEGEAKTVVAGQLGVDLAFGEPHEQERQMRLAVETIIASARVQQADLLVFPEGMIDAGSVWPPNTFFQVTQHPPIVFGGTRGSKPVYQSAFAFDGEWSHADKTRLVVFGEYVPFRDALPFLNSFELPNGDITPGESARALKAGELSVGPMLCFEGLFYDVAQAQADNGAQILATMSIDDWYIGTAAPDQLKLAAVFRAIETDLPLVRTASMGYSLGVNQRGGLLSTAKIGQTVALHLEFKVPSRGQRFPLVKAAPWVFSAALLWPIAFWVHSRLRPAGALKQDR